MSQSSVYAYLKGFKKEFDSHFKNGLIIISEERQSALNVSDVARFLGINTFVLPDFRAKFGEDLRSFQEELSEIFVVLREFYSW